MQIFRLEMITRINKITLILILIGTSMRLKAQITGNTNTQSKSPNANVQIGNGNISKPQLTNKNDNRKFYNIQNETNDINSLNAGTLITGNNPFITINNITPNIDSVKYEIELKKKNIRISLSRFMLQGHELKNRCFTDTNKTKLGNDLNQWTQNVCNYLANRLDEAYARQFDLVEINDGMGISGMTLQDLNRWNYIRARINKLDLFITSLY